MTKDIHDTLASRQDTHGSYLRNATITWDVMDSLSSGAHWDRLHPAQKETLHMIAHKMHRIVNGDPFFFDHWHDLEGYAALITKNWDQIVADTRISTTLEGTTSRPVFYKELLDKVSDHFGVKVQAAVDDSGHVVLMVAGATAAPEPLEPATPVKLEILTEAIDEAGFMVDMVPDGDGNILAGRLRLVPKPPRPGPVPAGPELSPEPPDTPAPPTVAPPAPTAPTVLQNTAVVLRNLYGAWELDGSGTVEIGGSIVGLRGINRQDISDVAEAGNVFPLTQGQKVIVEGVGSGVVEKRISDEYFRVWFGGSFQDVQHQRIRPGEMARSLLDERVADSGGPIIAAEDEPQLPSQVQREPINATYHEWNTLKDTTIMHGSMKDRRWGDVYRTTPDDDGRYTMGYTHQEEYGR